jgi:DNA repair protein RadA/Sms
VAKQKTRYQCSVCKTEYPRWQGQCSASTCKEWNTIEEVKQTPVSAAIASRGRGASSKGGYSGTASGNRSKSLSKVESHAYPKIESGIKELDRAMDGGFAIGSVSYLSGDPGAGKTTVTSGLLASQSLKCKTLFCTGEESEIQFNLRVNRMKVPYNDANFRLFCTTNVLDIIAEFEEERPTWAVVDSLQSINNPEIDAVLGGPTQQVECATLLTQAAKALGIILIIIGQVTKDDKAAGPKRIEHIVDGRLHIEVHDGELRTMRPHKNRFGSTETIGIFRMSPKGLLSVDNPSKLFLSGSKEGYIGAAVTCIRDGARTLLLEVQSLVDDSDGDYLERNSIGVSRSRMKMIMAVMSKYSRCNFKSQSVYATIVGGLKLQESDSSADLAIAASLYSSLEGFVLPPNFCFLGEIALSGEIRQIPNGVPRVVEASNHGFTNIIVPERNYHPSMDEKSAPNTSILKVKKINDLFNILKNLKN